MARLHPVDHAAIAEGDAYFDELAKLTTAHLRYGNDTDSNEPMAA